MIKTVGSTATLIADKFVWANMDIPKNIAGILLCAILSDTVIFKSPTTTDNDKHMAKYLANIANIKNIISKLDVIFCNITNKNEDQQTNRSL